MPSVRASRREALACRIAALPDPAYYTTAQAAAFLGLSPRVLEHYRESGVGPAFVRLGKRRCLYAKEDLRAWMDARKVRRSSDPIVRESEHDSGRAA